MCKLFQDVGDRGRDDGNVDCEKDVMVQSRTRSPSSRDGASVEAHEKPLGPS